MDFATPFSAALRPKPRLNVWQWADKFRYLAKGVSARSLRGDMRYRTSDAPHQRGIQESFTDPTVQVTVVIGASQISGKTECILNCVGFHMEHKPTNVIVCYPTIDSVEKFSKKKLTPAIYATPELNELVSPARSRDSGNTILVKEFRGGSIFMVGANSAASLRGASGQILIADEIDSYEASAGVEGDPVELLFKRGESYQHVVKILSSTPTIKGASAIWDWFEQSDQQYWFVPCPKCQHFQTLKWAQVRWPKGEPHLACYVCEKCEAELTDDERLAMYHAGEWRPTAPFRGIRGYHLNGIYCPWPAQDGFENRLHQMAVEHLRADKKGKEAIKVRVNTFLCECWEEEMEEAPSDSALLLRCEIYPEIPEKVCYLTAAVDTQKDRLEIEILGWGPGEETWGIETKKLFGNTSQPEVWDQLEEELSRSYQHPSGAVLKLGCVLIDSGGVMDNRAFAQPVYRFVKRRQGRYIFACKGSSEIGAPLVNGRLQKNGILLQMVGTDVCKSTVYERLQLETPGPGYMHFPQGRGYDEEYFKQLTAERVYIDRTRGFTKRKWVKTRARNEALDLRGYNIAAFEIRNVNLDACAANLLRSVEAKTAQKATIDAEAQAKTVADSHLRLHPAPQAKETPPTRQQRRRVGFVRW